MTEKNSRITHVSRKSKWRRGMMKKKKKKKIKKKRNTPVRIIFGYNRHYVARQRKLSLATLCF